VGLLIPSRMDIEHLEVIRKNVVVFMLYASQTYAQNAGRLLDIAPQVHEGASPFFSSSITIETLDIAPEAKTTYTADITQCNEFIPNSHFNYIVCTEVLEHTLNPFAAIEEIHRLLCIGGYLFLTVPFNFRIHGPLPDCWRFTEHGLRAILSMFDILELTSLETIDRPLMPIHYTVVARKRK